MMRGPSRRDRDRLKIPLSWGRVKIPLSWRLWAFLVLLVCVVMGFSGGYHVGVKAGQDDIKSSRVLRKQLESEQKNNNYLTQQLTNRLLAAEIDWKSVEQMRQMVGGLEEQLALQKEELDLYRMMLNRDSNVKGVHIEHWKVEPAGVTGVYDYQLVIRQNINLKATFKADLELVISGDQEGELIRYPLSRFDPEVDKETIRLSFRYFKFLRGRLQVPPGFQPKQVEIMVRRVGSSKYQEKKTFEWNKES